MVENPKKDSSLGNLIYHLKSLKQRNTLITNRLPNFDLLLTSLDELDGMIEMTELKDSVAKQVKFLLINNNNSDGHMLHTVLYGPPGVGKTKVCTILVKIWIALGAIKQPPNQESTVYEDNIIEKIKNLLLVSQMKSGVISNLQQIIFDLKQKLKVSVVDIERIVDQLKQTKPNFMNKNLYEQVNSREHTSLILLNKVINNLENISEIWEKIVKTYDLDEKVFFITEPIPLNNLNMKSSIDNSNNQTTGTTERKDNPNNQSEKTGNELDDMIKIVGRADFCGGYMGQSALKTEELLLSSLGKVLFIDEAYSLIHDETDSYGKEALTYLNTFMSERSDELVVIFAGYKDMMEQTIFKFQPGLKSRCTWMFEISDYSEEGLAKIFIKQAKEKGWKVGDFDTVKFFKKYKGDFPAFGRDTNRLLFYCKLCYSEVVFDSELENDKTLTKAVIIEALKYLRKHRIKDIHELPNTGIYL